MKTMAYFNRIALAAAALCILAPPAHAAPGDLDTSFNGTGKVTTSIGVGFDAGQCVAIQSDGKIVVAGYTLSGNYDFALARYHAHGPLDTSFGTGGKVTTAVGAGNDLPLGMAVQSDGKIVVVGYAHNGTDYDWAIVRYTSAGALDGTFGTGGKVTTAFGSGDDEAFAVVVQTDGKLVVGGQGVIGSNTNFCLARFTSTGALDATFGTGGKVNTPIGPNSEGIHSLALLSDGKILAGGFSNSGSADRFALARYTTAGALDTTFGTSGITTTAIGTTNDQAQSMVVQADGKIVLAGRTQNGTDYDIALARYSALGVLDTSFGTSGKVITTFGSSIELALGVALQTDGKIVIAGYAEGENFNDFAVARYTSAGALDGTFAGSGKVTTGFGGDAQGHAVAVQTDGKIVVAGYANDDFAVARYQAGAVPTRLTTSSLDDLAPNWHPTNAKIAYLRGTARDVGLVNTDGTGEALAASSLFLNGYAEALSWVGSTNALMVAETNSTHELLAFDTAQAPAVRSSFTGTQGTVFVSKLIVPGGNNSNVMVVSRDGTRMAWRDQPNAGGTNSLTIRTALYSSLSGQQTNTHGTAILTATNSSIGTRGMALTPTGDKLIIALPNGTGFDLWSYNSDGTGTPVQLTNEAASGIFNGAPDISPDGTRILWQRATATESDIWLMNLDGTDKRNITQTVGISEAHPCWGPNNVLYAYARFDGTQWDIYKDQLPADAGGTTSGGSNTMTIDFNDFPLGLLAGDALAAYGIPSVTFGGTGPGAGPMRIYDNTGSNHIIPSPPKLMEQDANGLNQNQTHILYFTFDPPLTSFSLKRTGKSGGGSTDSWQARFYDGSNNLLGQFGEGPIINAPVTTFTHTPSGGQTIARMELQSIWTGFATNRNIPVDDFTLTRAASGGGNAAPSATNLSAAETFTEDTAVNLTDIVVSDADSANVTATLTLSNTSAGSLSTGTSGAVTSTFSAGVWTASGAIANVNTLLAGVIFTPATDFNASFTIATSVSDGTSSVTGSKAMTGTTVNDAPTATNLSAAETYTEDTALNLTNIVVSDVDSATVTATLTLSTSSAGSLSTGTSGAVTSTFSAGVWSASGAIANVNTLLAGVTFTPAADFNANFTIATSVSDGVAAAITGSKAMQGLGANDAPVLNPAASPALTAVNEDAPAPSGAVGTLVSALVDFAVPSGQLDNVTDVDGGTLLGIAVTAADASNGTWYYTTTNGADWNTLGTPSGSASRKLAADVNTRLYFQPDANFNGTITSAITFRAWDRQGGGPNGLTVDTTINGGMTPFSSATDTASIVVNSVNDVPVVTLIGANPLTFEAAASYTDPGATASDVEDGVLTPTITSNTVVANAPGTYSVTWTATDSGSLSGNATRTVNVVDTTPPVISGVPANILAEATGPGGRMVTFTNPTASDLVDGARPVNCVPPSGSTFPIGTTTVVCTSTDTRSNSSSASFTVTVQDTTPPVLSLPANMTVEATGTGGTAVVTFTATANDLVSGARPVICNPPSGSTFNLGTTTVNCSATDAAGNPGSGSFTVTVQDTTAPVPPGVFMTDINIAMPATPITASFSGWTDLSMPLSYSIRIGTTVVVPPGADSTPTFTLPIGTHAVTGRVFDAVGNFTDAGPITVVVDGMAPTITTPGNLNVAATSPAGAVVNFIVSATDDNDPNPTVVANPPSGSTFPIGTTTVNVTATDDAGNEATASFTVSVGLLDQMISFTNPGGHTFGDAPFELFATGGGSGNPVTFSIVTGPATVLGSALTITGAGDVTVRASQAGDATHAPAADVDRTFTVAKAAQVITFTLASSAIVTDSVVLGATGGATGNPVTFSVFSGPGSITGNSLTFTGMGDVVVRASQAGSDNYLDAPNEDRTIAVGAVPLTLADDAAITGSGSILINVLANDTTEGGTLSLSSVTQPAPTTVGTAKVEAGKVRFTPKVALSAPITFTYTATNGSGVGTATVTIKPLSNALGKYSGLLSDGTGAVRGRVGLTVVATGWFSGFLHRDGSALGFKGILSHGSATVLTGRTTPPIVLTLAVGPDDALGKPTFNVSVPSPSGGTLTGTIEHGVVNPALVGRYTLVANLPGGGTGPATGAALTCNITSAGSATFAGRRGNGGVLSSSGLLLDGGRLPFYFGTGATAVVERLGGELVFVRSASPAVSGTLRWRVAPGINARLVAGVNQDYSVLGMPYTPGATAVEMFSPADVDASATLMLVLPSLSSSPIFRSVNLAGAPFRGTQRVTVPYSASRIDLVPGSGWFSGIHSPSRYVSRSFCGVVIQGAGYNYGQGFTLDSATIGAASLTP